MKLTGRCLVICLLLTLVVAPQGGRIVGASFLFGGVVS